MWSQILLKMMLYPAQTLKASPEAGDSQEVTHVASSPGGYLHWCQPWGEVDPGGPMKENIRMEEKGSGRKLGMLPSSAHMPQSFHGTERSVQVEMMPRGSLLLPEAWETQLVPVLGGPRLLISGKK